MLDITEVQGQRQAYQVFLSKANSVASEKLVAFRADAKLALQNVKTGVKNVLANKDKLVSRLKPEEIKSLEELLDVTQAFVFADSRVNALLSRSTGEISEKLEQCYKLRRILLGGAQLCSVAGLLTADEELELEKIEAGKSALDASQDCVDLVELYDKSERLYENTPATKDMLERAEQVGSELVLLLQSAATPKSSEPPDKLKESIKIRAQFWTLVNEGHELLLQAGTLLFGAKKLYQFVPKLQSREVKHKKTPPPTPS